MLTYELLDWFFMILHPAIIVFNLLGWIPRRIRKANLILLLLTGGSWFVLGIWKGIGYCPLTDWHFSVLNRLGAEDLPHSYVAYLMDRLIGWRLSDEMTDALTVTLFVVALICSIVFNIRDLKRSK
jgi:hypothetical protein